MVRSTLAVPRSFFVGFENLFNELEVINKNGRSTNNNYPPHNIVKVDEEKFLIELAVAGFTESDIDLEVKDGILTVAGKIDSTDEREYAYKGISSRKFEKSFRLAEYVVIDGADLVNGILIIHARVEVPEEKKPKKIQIGSPSGQEFIQD